MFSNHKKNLYYFIGSLLVLLIFSFALTYKFSLIQSLRIVFGLVLVFFVPGFAWSFIFIKKPFDLLERIAVSVGLSIAGVPLIIFLLNKVGLKINTINSVLIILFVTIIALVLVFFQKKKSNPEISSTSK